MDWSKMNLKVYSADKKQAEGLICLPTDNRIQVVKVDCGKAKPQLLNQVEGTSLNFRYGRERDIVTNICATMVAQMCHYYGTAVPLCWHRIVSRVFSPDML